MNPKNRAALAHRVRVAATSALAARKFVTSIDILVGVGWLAPSAVDRWRQGRLDRLEREVNANLARISEAMHLFRSWAVETGLKPSETDYIARTPGRPRLRFSVSGAHDVEKQYRTHWVSPALSEKKRNSLREKSSRPPELVVIKPLNDDWTCHRCGGGEGWLIMEPPGPSCLACAGLDDLVFLPAGDAGLTRRAGAASSRRAAVVRFSKARKRYERQGLLVEPQALAKAEGDSVQTEG